MSDFRFLADGRKRALQGLGPQLKELRLNIKKKLISNLLPNWLPLDF